MKQYFYIPRQYEPLMISSLENYFLDGGDFSIITGVYKEFTGVVDATNNPVYSKLRTGEISNIINGFEDSIQNKKFELVGYCMEGNFQDDLPAIYSQIQSLQGCLIFDTAEEYLQFIQTI